jgi:hypothetical protein
MERTARMAVVLTLLMVGTIGSAGPAGAAPADIGDPAVPDPAVRTTPISSDTPSFAEDVNLWGTVAGTGGPTGGQAFTWRPGRLRLLDPPNPGPSSVANAVNGRGDVLVQTNNGSRLLSHGRWREFPDTYGVALNDAGDVLLHAPLSQDLADPNRALLWRRGRLIELVPPGTPPDSAIFGTALNDAGQVLLRVYTGALDRPLGAYVWSRGNFVPLQLSQPLDNIEPRLLNDRGQVFGQIGPPNGPWPLAVWDRSGRPTVLPSPEGSIGVDVGDANGLGQLAGTAAFPDGRDRITLWTAGRPKLLPDIPGYSRRGGPVVINDLGQIAWTVWTQVAEDTYLPASFVWWFGRTVRLGQATVTDIGDGGDIIGQQGSGLDRAVTWSVDWLDVFRGVGR